MKNELLAHLKQAVEKQGIDASTVKLDYPEDFAHGDYSCNVAMANAKKLKMNPQELAVKIADSFKENMSGSAVGDLVETVNVAGPGFINFKLKDKVLAEKIVEIASGDGEYGWSKGLDGKEILIEYTDPNMFKAFHIGHLMSNAIGESISRLIQASGAKVVRLCYWSDIGLHIAKSIWAWQKHTADTPADDMPIIERTAFLGRMYVEGTNAYDADSVAKGEIDALNKVIYGKTDPLVNALYEKGKKWSSDHFNLLYKVLGTKFDEFILESEMAPVGLNIVKEYLKKGVFEESDGAIVFKGEKYGLHTRVFVNSHGLPTYEAKDMGLSVTKFRKYPAADRSIYVTASEQNDYFKVIIKALQGIDHGMAEKTTHIGHGMMRFADGKMSSRTGKVITAEQLLADIKGLVAGKIAGREFTPEEADEISNIIAVGAIKYSILRSSIGSDIIFDSVASISFEGDSGPYLQYAVVRAASVLEKCKLESGIKRLPLASVPDKVGLLERLIIRFPEIIERAGLEYAPQHAANYLIALAGAFNAFYASQTIIDQNDSLSPYKIALTKAFQTVMGNGLWTLGIGVPRRM